MSRVPFIGLRIHLDPERSLKGIGNAIGVKVGLIGFGMVAERFHVPLLRAQQDVSLAYVVERHGQRAAALGLDLVTLRSAEELLATDVEVVVVLTPNASHFQFAQQALQAGKHVVVDKPFTVTSAQADELLELAGSVGKVLTVFHNRRWDNDFLTLKKLVEEGAVGAVRRLESRWERYRPLPKGGWREQQVDGTGVLYDLGSHLIDQMLVLFGTPQRVMAHLQIQREGVAAVDCFDVTFDYGPWQVYLHSDCLTPVPSHRFALFGERGSFHKHGLDPQEEALAAGQLPQGPDWGREDESLWGTLERVSSEGVSRSERVPTLAGDYREFYRNLAATLAGHEKLHVTPESARDVILAIELCLESHQRGCWLPWPSRAGSA